MKPGTTAAVCCGTCRYFDPYNAMTRIQVGECTVPLPNSVSEESRTDMASTNGIKCDTWEPVPLIEKYTYDDGKWRCPLCGDAISTDPDCCRSCKEML